MLFLRSGKSEKTAFTLVEVMFVILIISVLAILAINAYVDARFRSLVIIQADRVAESIRMAKYLTQKGDAKAAYCKGIEIVAGSKIFLVSAEYSAKDGCGKLERESSYDLSYPVRIETETDESLLVYFEPPNGEMRVIANNNIIMQSREFSIQSGNETGAMKRIVVLDPISGSVNVKSGNND